MAEEVKLLGTWLSHFSCRVMWALKLKGVPFEYIEEDLPNKSALLLQYNPVYKKIPVLVHRGKPICESAVILEYMDEVWPQNPLLPLDPYERAVARFWIKFVEDKGPAVYKACTTEGEEQEKSVKDSQEMLKTIEELALGEKKFFGGDEIGMLDIVCGGVAHWLDVMEEVAGVEILERYKFPRFHAWLKRFEGVPIIKENLPDRDKMLVIFKNHRRKMLSASA